MTSRQSAKLTELRLTAFKSFANQTLPLADLTLIVGRNGSGKSNALEGLWVIARLASGEDIRDALDGARGDAQIRGGTIGCVPYGKETFSLGCSADTPDGLVTLDFTVKVGATVQIVDERLCITDADGESKELLTALPVTDGDSSDIQAKWWRRGTKGRMPHVTFRATRLLTSQVLSRIPATTTQGQKVHRAASHVLEALEAVFLLDPIPDAMRAYVNERDAILRRDASNISAALGDLVDAEPALKERFVTAIRDLNEQNVTDMRIESSTLGDVILSVVETTGDGKRYPLSARSLSDGTLRFLAILTALWQAPDSARDVKHVDTYLVIEEIENGLHPSQAEMLMNTIRSAISERCIRVLTTTHSPALLNAVRGPEHKSIVICERGSDGGSVLHRLTDLDNYLDIAVMGSLGEAASKDRLRSIDRDEDWHSGMSRLDEILGTSQ